MRNINESYMRLLVLYEHFEQLNLREKYPSLHHFFSDDKKKVIIGNGNGKYYVVYPFLIYELPLLFYVFEEGDDGLVRYIHARKLDIYYAIMEFFGLSVPEFLHLFAVNSQSVEEFGGATLYVESTSQDVAHNIACLLENSLKESKRKEKEFKSRVLIEKTKQAS